MSSFRFRKVFHLSKFALELVICEITIPDPLTRLINNKNIKLNITAVYNSKQTNKILKLINRVLDLFQNKDLGISEPNWSQKDVFLITYGDSIYEEKNNKLNAKNNKKTQPSNSKTHKTPQKLSYNQQQQLNSLPEKIENLENEILMAQKLLSDPTFYQNPDAQNLTIKLRETERQIEMLYDQWSKLDNGN